MGPSDSFPFLVLWLQHMATVAASTTSRLAPLGHGLWDHYATLLHIVISAETFKTQNKRESERASERASE